MQKEDKSQLIQLIFEKFKLASDEDREQTYADAIRVRDRLLYQVTPSQIRASRFLTRREQKELLQLREELLKR